MDPQSSSTPQQPQSPEEIRREMSNIRAHLGGEVDGLVANAQHLADWKHYVRAFPWGSLGVAAAVGYLVVPKRVKVVSPDKEMLLQLAKENRLVVDVPPVQKKPTLVSSALNLTGNMLLRAGIAYLGQQAGKVFGEQAADQSPGGVVH